MNATTIEKVAQALYEAALNRPPRNPWATSWDAAEPGLKDEYRDYARAGIRAHFEAHETPYADEEHQGGNLLELFLKTHAEGFRLRTELEEARTELARRQRQGQAAFNVLALMRPDLAEQINGDVQLDPFNDDAKLPAFFAWLIEQARDDSLLAVVMKRMNEDSGVRHSLDDALVVVDEEALRELIGDNPPSHPQNTPGPGTIGYF